MTEDEIRKEATSTVEWENTPMIDRPLFVHAYITGAEPRENRIAELEKENAELEAQIEEMKCCGNCAKYNSGYGETPCKLFASGICGEWETSIGKF